ncbi:MAG: hotdog fold thioesterase [Bacteroidia bacterium]|nr:MAG: hotdog fold thioesterase [Bacteroidia bacterium]
MKNPKEIVDEMMSKDKFSQWLNIKILEVDLGKCTLKTTVNEQMLNGHDIIHGGISYSLSDSALAFASNSRGTKCVSIETSISHLKKAVDGDELTVYATEINRSKSLGVYEVEIFNQNQLKISHFKGTVFDTGNHW